MFIAQFYNKIIKPKPNDSSHYVGRLVGFFFIFGLIILLVGINNISNNTILNKIAGFGLLTIGLVFIYITYDILRYYIKNRKD